MVEMWLTFCPGFTDRVPRHWAFDAGNSRGQPRRQLIQTEDLAKIFSTPLLAYEAEFENERRWLSLDPLCGRLTPDQLAGRYLLKCGIKSSNSRCSDHPCPPDVIGINHYLTSDRFLDERMDRYPTWSHGGNDRHQYADVEAVRVDHPGASGHRILPGKPGIAMNYRWQ